MINLTVSWLHNYIFYFLYLFIIYIRLKSYLQNNKKCDNTINTQEQICSYGCWLHITIAVKCYHNCIIIYTYTPDELKKHTILLQFLRKKIIYTCGVIQSFHHYGVKWRINVFQSIHFNNSKTRWSNTL